MPKGIYLHKSLGRNRKKKIGQSVSVVWKQKRKGKTYEEIFGSEKAQAMREKQRLAKLGKNFHWSKPHPTGKDAPNWRGGTNNREIHSLNNPRYKGWRTVVFERDNFNCRMANEDCHGKLQAHHILPWRDYPELRYTINNGIVLCQAHHPRKWAEEKRLAPIFQQLVSVSK